MDSLTKQLYWKQRKLASIISWACVGLMALSGILFGTWMVYDFPRLTQTDHPGVHLALSVKALFAIVPYGISVVAQVTVAFMTVHLRCQHCKHTLESHEERNGKTHPCRIPHFSFHTFRFVHCNCPAFVPAEKL